MRKALAVYLGCALIAAYVVVRAWDHFRGRPPEPDPWAALPQPDLAPIRPKSAIWSDNLTAADDPPLWWSGWQDTSRWN